MDEYILKFGIGQKLPKPEQLRQLAIIVLDRLSHTYWDNASFGKWQSANMELLEEAASSGFIKDDKRFRKDMQKYFAMIADAALLKEEDMQILQRFTDLGIIVKAPVRENYILYLGKTRFFQKPSTKKPGLEELLGQLRSFEQALSGWDSSIALSDEESRKAIKSERQRLEKYNGMLLVQTSPDMNDLGITVTAYSTELILRKGMLRTRDVADKLKGMARYGERTQEHEKVYVERLNKIGGPTVLYNTVAGRMQLQKLDSMASIGQLAEGELLKKAAAVFDPGWRDFLMFGNEERASAAGMSAGAPYYRFTAKGIEAGSVTFENGRRVEKWHALDNVIVDPLVKAKVEKWFEVIRKKDEEVRQQRDEFNKKYPGIEAKFRALYDASFSGRRYYNANGWVLHSKISICGKSLESWNTDAIRKDIMLPEAFGAEIINLYESFARVPFEKYETYDELIKRDPQLREKIDYIMAHQELVPDDEKQRVNVKNLNLIRQKDRKPVMTRDVRFRENIPTGLFYEEISTRLYEPAIVETVGRIYKKVI